MAEAMIDQLLRQVILLKGDLTGTKDDYEYGPSLCVGCWKPVSDQADQDVDGRPLASAEGLYFRVKKACKCKCSVAFVSIEAQKVQQA